MPKGKSQKPASVIRSVTLRVKRKTQIGEQVSKLVSRIGACQVLFAYMLGWLKDASYESLIQKTKEIPELQSLMNRFDSLGEVEKRWVQSLVFYFTLMGSKSHDVFYAMTGKKGDKWGSLYTELRTQLESFIGGWFDKKVKVDGVESFVPTRKEGLFDKIFDAYAQIPLENHPPHPLEEEISQSILYLDLAEAYLRFLEKRDTEGNRPEPFFSELLSYLSGSIACNMQAKLLKLFVNAIAYKNKAHLKLLMTKKEEEWGLIQEEQRLLQYAALTKKMEESLFSHFAFSYIECKEADIPEDLHAEVRKLKKMQEEIQQLKDRGEAYRNYLQFREAHPEFIQEVVDLGRDGRTLYTSQIIRDWLKDKTTDEEINALSTSAVSDLPFVKWFAINHAQFLKFRKGVTYPTFTPASCTGQEHDEDAPESDEHEHHFSWPASSSTAKGLYDIILEPTSNSERGCLRIKLPFGGEEDIEFFSPKGQWRLFSKQDPRYAFRVDQCESSRQFYLPARVRGLKIVPLDRGGLEFHLAVDVHTPEREKIWDSEKKAWIIPDGTILAGVSILQDGTLWGVRARVDATSPMGVTIVYSGPLSYLIKSSNFHERICVYDQGRLRILVPQEINTLMGCIGDNIRAFRDKKISQDSLRESLERSLGTGLSFVDIQIDQLLRLFTFRRMRAEGLESLIVEKHGGGVSVLLQIHDQILKKLSEYRRLKKEKNRLLALKDSVSLKRISQVRKKQGRTLLSLIELRSLNLNHRKSRIRHLANVIAQFGLGHIRKEGQDVRQSAIVFLPEIEPKDKMKGRSKFRGNERENTVRTLRGEGELFDKASDHFELLGINMLRSKCSPIEHVCPKCSNRLVPYSQIDGSIQFERREEHVLRSRKLCCSNQSCSAKGLDPGYVLGLNMIISFLRGKNFKMLGSKAPILDAHNAVIAKLTKV